MGFSQATIFSQIACIISIVGVFCLFVGAFTVAWVTLEASFTDYGLFQTCIDSECQTSTATENSGFEWFEATRGMVVIGAILSLFCMVALVYWVCVSNKKTSIHTVAMILAFTAGLCVLIGVIVFGAKWESFQVQGATLGWSFGLTVASSLVFLIIGGLLVFEKIKR